MEAIRPVSLSDTVIS